MDVRCQFDEFAHYFIKYMCVLKAFNNGGLCHIEFVCKSYLLDFGEVIV